MNRFWPAVALSILTFTGCGWKGDPLSHPEPKTVPTVVSAVTRPAEDSPPTPTDSHWTIRPAQMRFYPTTRFTLPHAPCELDLRVELLDELGDPIKAVGDWRIELYDSLNAAGVALSSWEIPMRTREQNLQHYDRITRSYHLRLKVDRMAGDQQPMWLSVTLMPIKASRWQVQGLIDPQHGLVNP